MQYYKKISSPYNPQCNVIVEKMNSTIIRGLGKYVNENLDNWDEFLERFLDSYRWSRHSTTYMSPYKALYGRDPIHYVDIQIGSRSLLSNEQDLQPNIKILNTERKVINPSTFDNDSCIDENKENETGISAIKFILEKKFLSA